MSKSLNSHSESFSPYREVSHTLNISTSEPHTYLGNTHSLDVYLRLQSKVRSCGELSDAELGWGELHCCHLLAVVGWHDMLTQDQRCVGIIGPQQIQAGAPLKYKVWVNNSSIYCRCLHVMSFVQMLVLYSATVPVAEWHCPLFLWVSVASTGPWYPLCCYQPAPSSKMLCAHGWCQLPRFLGRHIMQNKASQ